MTTKQLYNAGDIVNVGGEDYYLLLVVHDDFGCYTGMDLRSGHVSKFWIHSSNLKVA